MGIKKGNPENANRVNGSTTQQSLFPFSVASRNASIWIVSLFYFSLQIQPLPGNQRKVKGLTLLVTAAETVVICARLKAQPLPASSAKYIAIIMDVPHKKKGENIGDDALKEFYSTVVDELQMGPE